MRVNKSFTWSRICAQCKYLQQECVAVSTRLSNENEDVTCDDNN